ncbi:MAG: hypothetical protein JKX98_00710 [Alcanivoracaceae bacterium]|nr:hypothetical protein [Alcanivoracaceae bacterium]
MIDKNRRPIYKTRRENLLYFYKHWSGADGVKTWQALAKLAGIDRTKLSGAVSNSGVIIGDSYADKLEAALALTSGILDRENKDQITKASADLLDKIHAALLPLLDEMQVKISDDEYSQLVLIASDYFKGTGSVSIRVLRKIYHTYFGKVL